MESIVGCGRTEYKPKIDSGRIPPLVICYRATSAQPAIVIQAGIESPNPTLKLDLPHWPWVYKKERIAWLPLLQCDGKQPLLLECSWFAPGNRDGKNDHWRCRPEIREQKARNTSAKKHFNISKLLQSVEAEPKRQW
jgi:hypothetical protein